MTEPAQTADLLTDVLDYLRRYMVLSEEQFGTLALWTLHTHAIDAANATPYLRVTSALPSCGKTRLFEVLEVVSARPLMTSGLSAAALPRAVEQEHPTLLLDELDNHMQGDREMAASLTGILNSGYRRGGSTRKLVPSKGNKWELVKFDVFCPKAFAGMKELDKALSSRCIPIRIQPKRPDQETTDFYVGTTPQEHGELVGRLEDWGTGAVEQLSQIKPRRLASVTDRTAEVWEPLLQIAELAGSEWLDSAQQHAHALYFSEEHMDEADFGSLALRKLRGLFGKTHPDVPTADLLTALNGDAELPFAEMGKEGITGHKLARLLRPFGVHPVDIGSQNSRRKGYTWHVCSGAFETYRIPPADR